MKALRVITPGFLTTIQDIGRTGYLAFGVPPSGAMDWFALHAANRLAGNLPDAAGLEFTLEAPELLAEADCLVAAAGRGFDLWVSGRWVGLWMAAWVRRGEVIQFSVRPEGGWGYLAVAGGIATEPVLGSRATYLRGALGGLDGRALQAGDLLPVGPVRKDCILRAGAYLSARVQPRYSELVELLAVPGPQAEAFREAGQAVFYASAYQISPASDRVGYRLTGERVTHSAGADLLSEGMAPGSVQVPADGQPIVMMSDRPTTGGYPKIATVGRASLPLLAQCQPGLGRVMFRQVSVQAAQQAYRCLLASIDEGIEYGED